MKHQRVPAKVWKQVVAICFVVTLCVVGFSSRYRIGLNAQSVTCLPFKAYLVDLSRAAIVPERGGIFTFDTHGLMPFFKDGSHFVKLMSGLPGDRLDVDADGFRINGQKLGDINASILAISHRSLKDITRSVIIPADSFLMVGSTPESYDGRYWGFITSTQLTGKAYPLW